MIIFDSDLKTLTVGGSARNRITQIRAYHSVSIPPSHKHSLEKDLSLLYNLLDFQSLTGSG